MKKETKETPDLSRRQFTKGLALTGAGLLSSPFAGPMDAFATQEDTISKDRADILKESGIKPPTFNIKKLNSTAEQIYKCKPELSRFNQRNMAFKQVSLELGTSFLVPMKKNLKKAVKDSRIGHGVRVKSPGDARAHLALGFGMNTWNHMIGPFGEGNENLGNLSWNPLHIPKGLYEQPLPSPNPVDLTRKIKQMARVFGADMSGICKINRKWIYEAVCRNVHDSDKADTKPIVFKEISHPMESDSELIIPESVNNAIMFVVAMPYASTQLGPSTTHTMGSGGMGYGRMGLTAVALAETIRAMGYNAIPSMNCTGLSIPMAIDAGLGQLGRLGYMITPQFGPHVRIGKVLTDMPLVPDSPIDFGVTEYCASCGICAKECPSGAISPDRGRTDTPPASTGNPGAMKWYINGKKCLRWWMQSGYNCSRCMAVCPYTKMKWTDYYKGNPDPDRFWDLEMAPFGYQSVNY